MEMLRVPGYFMVQSRLCAVQVYFKSRDNTFQMNLNAKFEPHDLYCNHESCSRFKFKVVTLVIHREKPPTHLVSTLSEPKNTHKVRQEM